MNLTLVNDVASSRIVLVLVSVACNAVTVVRDRRGMSSRSSRSGTTAPWMQTKLRLTTDRSRADIHLFHGRKYTQAAVEPTGQERASTSSMGASTRRLPSSRQAKSGHPPRPWAQVHAGCRRADRPRAGIHLVHGRKYTQAAVEPSDSDLGVSRRRVRRRHARPQGPRHRLPGSSRRQRGREPARASAIVACGWEHTPGHVLYPATHSWTCVHSLASDGQLSYRLTRTVSFGVRSRSCSRSRSRSHSRSRSRSRVCDTVRCV